MKCATCQRDTAPVTIAGQVYCSVCGNPYQKTAGPKPIPAAAMHQRGHSGHVIDLRGTAPKAATPAARTHGTIIQHTDSSRHLLPKTSAEDRHETATTTRLDQAKHVSRSSSISRFAGASGASPKLAQAPAPKPAVSTPAAPRAAAPSPLPPPPSQELPAHVAAQHAALARLAATAPPPPDTPPAKTSPGNFKPTWRPNLKLSPAHRRIATTAAAIAVMAGYIWLHNYPKLTLANANSQAGIAATMPGYMPSSYTLNRTAAQPGVISLSFASPSAAQPLVISQQRTNWDSSSLVDDYLGQTTDDYDTVQGEGLTIYLYGNNNATWVNHGLWYSIEGASRLSRDEILKIAYSL